MQKAITKKNNNYVEMKQNRKRGRRQSDRGTAQQHCTLSSQKRQTVKVSKSPEITSACHC